MLKIKDVEGSDPGLIWGTSPQFEVLAQNLSEDTEESHERPQGTQVTDEQWNKESH
jgi:hypothetical protein